MKADDAGKYRGRWRYDRLAIVFLSSAAVIFGLLFRAMIVHDGAFNSDAFAYWAPRAAAVVALTTLLGLGVNKRGYLSQFAFGAVVGFVLAVGYVWITS